jgi:putative ABC transport system ATP-binding protein
MIELKGVSKIYGKKANYLAALQDINLKVPNGETVAITGKSGSGKSTLMHIMSGLDSPSEGHVIVDGKELHHLKPKQVDAFRANEMSFIFQAFFVEGNQNCYQNVMLPLEIAQVSRSKRKDRVLAALKAVELEDKTYAKARDLSGGQKQRLAIARAIVNKPSLIFADEPTGNLDSTTGDKVIQLLFDLNKKLKSTLVIVTHDHELARRCQKQIHLIDGRIDDIENHGQIKRGQVI